MTAASSVETLRFEDGTLYLLDQRRLPAEVTELALRDAAAVADAIRDMVVRGAPAIGVTAAFLLWWFWMGAVPDSARTPGLGSISTEPPSEAVRGGAGFPSAARSAVRTESRNSAMPCRTAGGATISASSP